MSEVSSVLSPEQGFGGPEQRVDKHVVNLLQRMTSGVLAGFFR